MVSKDKDAMSQVANSFDGIIDTVSADHPLPDYLVGRQTRVPLQTPPLACRLAGRLHACCSACAASL